MNIIRDIIIGLNELAFPNVCVCCGHETTSDQREICTFCLSERFDEPVIGDSLQTASNIMLPEGVIGQIALWNYDKGGILQDLMHLLKYNGITNIGIQLGQRLGEKLSEIPRVIELIHSCESVLVPVPLHYLKYRFRGFNQAYMIARGIQKVMELSICSINDVVRKRNTGTQTGLSLRNRVENIQNAFKVRNSEKFHRKLVIVVDDVFTTGATSFELCRCLLECGATGVLILTIAQA